eukprot:TRINITY_DN3723_c0_g1_i1.p1 TRINITY_DN3723_c0_g1~~TRINITY_DN3723_c0_g1_i1.p1  ORF type:complete len:536 (-),score=147.50 TRINITY_DN3723_c0_g1_i1:245-1852(-)
MSWDFNMPSPVADILAKETFTLTELLEEDETPPESRNENDKLTAFLTKPDILTELIKYVTVTPPKGSSDNVINRFPVVAMEILCCGTKEMTDALLNQKKLEDLLAFFADEEINVLLSNLVVEVIVNLLQSEPVKVEECLLSDAEWLPNVCKHPESGSVGSLLARFLSMDPEESELPMYLINQGVVENLFAGFNSKFAERHSDLSLLLTDLLAAETWKEPVVQRMASFQNVETLFAAMVDSNNPTALRYATVVVTRLLRTLLIHVEDEDNSIPVSARKGEDIPVIITVVISHVPSLLSLLQTPPGADKVIPSSAGKPVARFGPYRHAIMGLLDEVLSLSYEFAQNSLLQSKTFQVTMELLTKFPNNSFCHHTVQQLYSHFLEQSEAEAQLEFLKTTDAVKIVLEHQKAVTPESKPAFLPFLYNIASTVDLVSQTTPQVAEYLEGIEGWDEFKEFLVEYEKAHERMDVNGQDDEEAFGDDFEGDDGDNDRYLDGIDNDEGALLLPADIDMDSADDGSDYDIEQAEILLSKAEIEAFA